MGECKPHVPTAYFDADQVAGAGNLGRSMTSPLRLIAPAPVRQSLADAWSIEVMLTSVLPPFPD
jgi:hypothetical protein